MTRPGSAGRRGWSPSGAAVHRPEHLGASGVARTGDRTSERCGPRDQRASAGSRRSSDQAPANSAIAIDVMMAMRRPVSLDRDALRISGRSRRTCALLRPVDDPRHARRPLVGGRWPPSRSVRASRHRARSGRNGNVTSSNRGSRHRPGQYDSPHAPLQGAGDRPALHQARRGRQDRHHPDPGLRQGPGGREGDPQDHQPVRGAPGALHPRVADALPRPRRSWTRSRRPRSSRRTWRIREDLALFAAGETMLEAVDKVAEEHERNVRLVLLLLAGLRALDDGARRSRRRRRVVPAEAAVAVRVPSRAHARAPCAARPTRSCSRPAWAAPSAPTCAEGGAAPRLTRARSAASQQLAVADLSEAGDVTAAGRPGPQGVARAALRVRRVPPGAPDEVAPDAREDRAVSSYLPDIDPRARARRTSAIVMDGNGRWATQRGLQRTEGHARGGGGARRHGRGRRRGRPASGSRCSRSPPRTGAGPRPRSCT